MPRGKKKDFPVQISVKVGKDVAHGLLFDKKKTGEEYITTKGDKFMSARMNSIVIDGVTCRVSLNIFPTKA